MKKVLPLFIFLAIGQSLLAQNVFTDNFSNFNLAKIDGQNGWSTATPSMGNGVGGCFSIGCNVLIANKTMSYPNFASVTKALNPLDGVLATGDGPGKSVGTAVNSGSLYVALLVNFSVPAASTQPNANKQVIRFMDNGFTTAARIYIQQFGGGAFKIGIDKNGSPTNYSSGTYNYATDHLLILKYKFNTGSTSDDEVSLFVNPDLTQPEPASPTLMVTGSNDATSITRVAFPWNTASLITAGYVGAVSVAKDWSQSSLPIEGVTDIKAIKINNNKALLSWQLNNGSNVKEFSVQQSANADNLKSIAVLNNNGNTTYTQEINLNKGINYLRLEVKLKDGSKKLSSIYTLKTDNIIKAISVYPNPANSSMQVSMNTEILGKYNIQILDMYGRTISNQIQTITNSETNFTISTAHLVKGYYTLKITAANGEVETKMFSKI